MSERCSKCDGPMEAGFVADVNGRAYYPQAWVAGRMQQSIFGWLKVGKERRVLTVASRRCTACGFLELYAPDPKS